MCNRAASPAARMEGTAVQSLPGLRGWPSVGRFAGAFPSPHGCRSSTRVRDAQLSGLTAEIAKFTESALKSGLITAAMGPPGVQLNPGPDSPALPQFKNARRILVPAICFELKTQLTEAKDR
jgi:hypothetical protein